MMWAIRMKVLFDFHPDRSQFVDVVVVVVVVAVDNF